MNRLLKRSMVKKQKLKILKNKTMCKIEGISTGIKKLDFTNYRGKMAVYLTDGRTLIIPLNLFPDIKQLSVKQRQNWMILDDQFFTFGSLSKIFSLNDLMKLQLNLQ